MISQIDIEKTLRLQPNKECLFVSVATVLNHVVDAVNALVYDHDKDSDWYDGQTRAENVQPDAESRPENVQKETFVSIDEALKMGKKVDPYAEERKWEGKLCWFWDADPEDKIVDVLSCIDTSDKYPYVMCDHQVHYKHCEPVKPTDSIISKGE